MKHEQETITILVDRAFKRLTRLAAANSEQSLSEFARAAIAKQVNKSIRELNAPTAVSANQT